MPLSAGESDKRAPWKNLIEEYSDSGTLKGTTCGLHKQMTTNDANDDDSCVCGRLIRAHSYRKNPESGTSASGTRKKVHRWNDEDHAQATEVTVYGELENGARFLRYDMSMKPYDTLVDILEKNVGSKPKLLASIYGGAQYFTMTDALEREFMSGIGQLATTEDVWLLTTGLNSGVSKLIGQGVHRSSLLGDGKWESVVIGMNKWGTIDEQTRQMLKNHTSSSKYKQHSAKPTFLDENHPMTIDRHHTYFFLLDDGCLTGYLDDTPRSDFAEVARVKTGCHAVTIIVEGGKNTLEVIKNDLNKNRPVVIVHGSGRLATVLGNLLDGVDEKTSVSVENIKEQLADHPSLYPREENVVLTDDERQKCLAQHAERVPLTPDEEKRAIDKAQEKKALGQERERADVVKAISSILDLKKRKYLNVFRLDRDANLMNTIVRAVVKCQITTENREALLDLAVDWNCVEGADDIFKYIQMSSALSSDNSSKDKRVGRDYYPKLFRKALQKNRPLFVDYFLRRYYDPLDTVEFIKYKKGKESPSSNGLVADSSSDGRMRKKFAHDFILSDLYGKTKDTLTEITFERPKTMKHLDHMYFDLIGPYVNSFFKRKSSLVVMCKILRSLCSCCRCSKRTDLNEDREERAMEEGNAEKCGYEKVNLSDLSSNGYEDGSYDKQEMLRDIFLWSVCENYTDIAFVLLLQIKSRICAALVGAGIAQHLSRTNKSPHAQILYKKHREALEEYASACIDECYRQNRRRACQLILREIPLFGNVTCMQVAIDTRSISFINTDCFDRVLNRQWYDHIEIKSVETAWGICQFFFYIATLGLFAPLWLQYRESEKDEEHLLHHSQRSNADTDRVPLNPPDEKALSTITGVEVEYTEAKAYGTKWKHFHASPAVMVVYDFALYTWFLLVFSFFLLYSMKSPDQKIHWTEIYVIITVTALLIEEFRRVGMEMVTLMMERWHRNDLVLMIAYAAPYALFYIGIGLHFGSRARPDLFTAARIVLAVDLELWFLFSLRFVSAVKLLGPKLFMIQNMIRDLFSLLYIILICIAAYGVVSRALTMYNEVKFTAKSVATSVLYHPYWFLYGLVDDERKALDEIISSEKSSDGQVAEATVTHVLLAFHMLFINILLLSLLVAMLNFSIENVQALNKYFWRYQRYGLVREYFEKPMFAYPPLSLLVYVVMLIRFIYLRGHISHRIFKHMAKPAYNAYWTEFEHASTCSHARSLVEEKYRPQPKEEPKPNTTDDKQQEMQSTILKLQNGIDEMQAQNKELMEGMKWMMGAMKQAKMADENVPSGCSQATTSPV